MPEVMKIDTIQRYNDYFGVDTLHPMVTVIDGKKAKELYFCKKLYNIYAILLKDGTCGNLKYGQSIYDYQQGSMLFLAPGLVMGSEDDGLLHQPEGYVVAFHPEFLHGTQLAQLIKNYSYFSYNANEALHLSKQERATVLECMNRIGIELESPIDKHSKSLISDHIKVLLDYCERFYDRQFTTRENTNHEIIVSHRLTASCLYKKLLIVNSPICDGCRGSDRCRGFQITPFAFSLSGSKSAMSFE